MPITAIVLAAGEGTRMKSRHPKVLHTLLDRPLVSWVTRAARLAGAERIVVVVGSGADEVRAHLAHEPGVECVEQTERLGTAHAVRIALEQTGIAAGSVVVLNGDVPLVEPATITQLAATIGDKTAAAVLTMKPDNPHGYGRVAVADNGTVERIVEQRDCTPEEDATLLECNAGCYAFDGAALAAHIGEVGCQNAQNEYYLPDMVEVLARAGLRTERYCCEDPAEALGVNSRAQLAELTCLARTRINDRLMAEGVTMLDPSLVWVGPDVQVGRDATLLPLTMLWGSTTIGEGTVVGPNTRLTNCTVGENCSVDETVGISATLDSGVTVGPRAYLRPGAHLCDRAHVGTHVEIKNSTVGEGSKVPHLSYIGDTTIGSGVNIGAGSITCNYDGVNKHRTSIGDGAFIGSDTMMVAPVSIGTGALVGASSCITKDVPDGALAIERSDQRIVEGYATKRAERLGKDKA